MTQNIIKHNYRINDVVFYYNFATTSFGRGNIVQVDIEQYLENLSPKTVVYYHTISSNGSPYKSNETDTFYNADGSGSPNPPDEIVAEFSPGDLAWMVNSATNGAYQIMIVSIDVKKFDSYVRITYLVNYDIDDECCPCENSVYVNENDLYASSNEAFAAIGVFQPSSTPSPTPTLTPTITQSSTITPTPTPTITVSVSLTATPTPTPTPSPSFVPSATPVTGASSLVVSKLNSTGITLNKGTPVSLDNMGQLVKTSCNNYTALSYLGIVYDDFIDDNTYGRVLLEGSINNSVINWNDILIEGSGLQAGKKYYLTTTPGKMSLAPPTTGYVKNIGFAIDNMTLDLRDGLMIKI